MSQGSEHKRFVDFGLAKEFQTVKQPLFDSLVNLHFPNVKSLSVE